MKIASWSHASRMILPALLLIGMGALALPAAAQDGRSVVFEDNFEQGADRWRMDGTNESWKVITTPRGKVLRTTGMSNYKPPQTSPRNIAWVKDLNVGDFTLTTKVESTNYPAGAHRDMCLFWGRQDDSHFYYVHLGKQSDPRAGQIFLVNGKDRAPLTNRNAKEHGIPWDKEWHDIKIVRRVSDGTIEVYFDDMITPEMTTRDKTFTWGQVGLGTFDDNGNWDDFRLEGVKVEPKAK